MDQRIRNIKNIPNLFRSITVPQNVQSSLSRIRTPSAIVLTNNMSMVQEVPSSKSVLRGKPEEMLGPIVSLGLPNPITLGHRTGVAHDLFSDVIGRLVEVKSPLAE